MLGITLILVPTIVYGGLTLLGVVTSGELGTPGPRDLTPEQQMFYRAGHAHAGVLLILSLVVQIAAEHARLERLEWPARVGAAAAPVLVSGGFFGVAHLPALAALLYSGVAVLVAVVLTVGIGLVRAH